jgi:hypothetical protein
LITGSPATEGREQRLGAALARHLVDLRRADARAVAEPGVDHQLHREEDLVGQDADEERARCRRPVMSIARRRRKRAAGTVSPPFVGFTT